jgi:curved DNA-binding protein CbpA
VNDDLDAYRILQVDPRAEDFILEAAFRAMARRFHPDGETPDAVRMAEINRAYELVRTSERRKRYDRLHHRRPVGPGEAGESPSLAAQALAGRVPPINDPDGPTAADNPMYMTVDFGRYQGWTLKDLLRYDPDYLRWLYRHSSGVRYRYQIARMLPDVLGEEALVAKRNKY